MTTLHEKRTLRRDFLLLLLSIIISFFFINKLGLGVLIMFLSFINYYTMSHWGINKSFNMRKSVLWLLIGINIFAIYYFLNLEVALLDKIIFASVIFVISTYLITKNKTFQRYKNTKEKYTNIGQYTYMNKRRFEVISDYRKFMKVYDKRETVFPVYLFIKTFIKTRQLHKQKFENANWENNIHSRIYFKTRNLLFSAIKGKRQKINNILEDIEELINDSVGKSECKKCQNVYSKENMTYTNNNYNSYWVCGSCNNSQENTEQNYSQSERKLERWKDILDLNGCITMNDIEKAYRKKVKQVHPDVGGSSEDFKKVKKAREKLEKHYKGY